MQLTPTRGRILLTPNPHEYGKKHSCHIVKEVRLLQSEMELCDTCCA